MFYDLTNLTLIIKLYLQGTESMVKIIECIQLQGRSQAIRWVGSLNTKSGPFVKAFLHAFIS